LPFSIVCSKSTGSMALFMEVHSPQQQLIMNWIDGHWLSWNLVTNHFLWWYFILFNAFVFWWIAVTLQSPGCGDFSASNLPWFQHSIVFGYLWKLDPLTNLLCFQFWDVGLVGSLVDRKNLLEDMEYRIL
jgi:hypothetical protein